MAENDEDFPPQIRSIIREYIDYRTEKIAFIRDALRYRWLREHIEHINFNNLTCDTCDVGMDHAIDMALDKCKT
jgi:hypothetical protein